MTQEALKRVAEKLRRTGASIPAPEVTGTIEGSVVTGLCIALALVEGEIEALADPMREVQRLGQEIEQKPPQRTWIGLEGAEAGWFCHTDFLNARKYTKKQREHICNQLMSEAQSWDIEQYTLMMHDSTKRPFIGLTDEEQQQAYEQWQNEGWGVFYNAIEAKLRSKNT
jgi:uncharacterized protein YoaH (UPF0181 family)